MHRRMFLRTLALGAPALALVGCVPEEGAYYGPTYGSTAFYYDYYPAWNVYYHPAAQVWYYPHGGRWLRARHLPPHYRITARDRRRIYHSGGHPYERNQNHRRGRFDEPPRDERRQDRRETRDDRRETRRDTQARAEAQARAEQEARRTERQTRRNQRQESRQTTREAGPLPEAAPVPSADNYRNGPPTEQPGIR